MEQNEGIIRSPVYDEDFIVQILVLSDFKIRGELSQKLARLVFNVEQINFLVCVLFNRDDIFHVLVGFWI